MHEMAITTNIVDAVVRYAADNDAVRVAEVRLMIGELRDVVDSLMEGAFRHLARGTVAADASLVIRKVPLRARCWACNLVFPADVHRPETLVCPDCGGRELSIHNGKEFLIESIAIETADPCLSRSV